MILSLHPPAREPAAACAICDKLRAAIAFQDEHPPRDGTLRRRARYSFEMAQRRRRAHALAVRFVAYVKGKAAQ